MEHVSFISSIIIRHAGPLASMLAPQIMCMYRLLFFFSSVVSSVEVRLGRTPPPGGWGGGGGGGGGEGVLVSIV